jgi:hypothetical protein
MTKLTDTQLVILTAACQRPDRCILPLPAQIKGGAAQKVVAGLLSRRLTEEAEAGRESPVWRETAGRRGVTLVATDAALEILGIESASVATRGDTAALAETDAVGSAGAVEPPTARDVAAPRKSPVHSRRSWG